MKIAVIGAGALGGYFGGLLANVGNDVTFVVRERTAEALTANGLRIVGQTEIHLPKVNVATDAATVGPVDLVLITPKMQQLDASLGHLPPLIGEQTGVLTVQNGVQAPDKVAGVVGREHVLPGIARVFTNADEPGVIRHSGGPNTITFSEWDDRESDRSRRVRETLTAAGIDAPTVPSIWVDQWEKFAYVEPNGALGSLLDLPLGKLLSDHRELFTGFINEVIAVGRSRGVALGDDVTAKTLAFADRQPATATTSLQRDLAAGVVSELDGQVGAVVELAAVQAVPVPLHQLAYAALVELERSNQLRA